MSDAARTAILIVDDHALFRESVARLLSREPDFDVVGDVGALDNAFAVLSHRRVDVVLLDFDLGPRDGLDFMRLARHVAAHPKILVVTAGIEPTIAGELIRAGVAGIFLKRDSAACLVQAIREAIGGKVSFDQELFQRAISDAPALSSSARNLTDREHQVLSGVFEGLANKEIAARIGVSESSVKATLQQLFAKTGVRTRSQLVRVALERYHPHL